MAIEIEERHINAISTGRDDMDRLTLQVELTCHAVDEGLAHELAEFDGMDLADHAHRLHPASLGILMNMMNGKTSSDVERSKDCLGYARSGIRSGHYEKRIPMLEKKCGSLTYHIEGVPLSEIIKGEDKLGKLLSIKRKDIQ